MTDVVRLKAGTAQKMVLNAFSTAVMVRLGKTYSNLMVDLHASNQKLRSRTLAILREASGADVEACREALRRADGDLKTALVMLRSGLTPEHARAALGRHRGNARSALGEHAATRGDPTTDGRRDGARPAGEA
jgi:N-acetylmuramic acid 6-phosphate etherase